MMFGCLVAERISSSLRGEYASLDMNFKACHSPVSLSTPRTTPPSAPSPRTTLVFTWYFWYKGSPAMVLLSSMGGAQLQPTCPQQAHAQCPHDSNPRDCQLRASKEHGGNINPKPYTLDPKP